ncbi:trans-aconitate 2-methyltransferase [Congregibacter brevis]|uniref:Trans-aconitate 2-methyltransferase n=1 Tax=Congregibacter brevis TaxID=3081201 RepID=A0ABZ0ICC3_9GAMM|nr:trans-aconitate 2-methyltransferase [Congregibacter sp. IMCC45268]
MARPINDWNARQYDDFAEQRQQAAIDLVAAIPPLRGTTEPAKITDLGCGSGLSTCLLTERWPDAAVTGIDKSPDMLARAAERVPQAKFQQDDIANFKATQPQELIFANASLHWLPDHRKLFTHLAQQLSFGGILAVQMPNTLSEPSHQLMSELALRPAFAEHLSNLKSDREDLLTPMDYYDALAPVCDEIKLWETHYHHVLDGSKDILRWFASTGLKPYLDMLPEGERPDFEKQYIDAIALHYPSTSDGKVLLRLPRFFVIARRRA